MEFEDVDKWIQWEARRVAAAFGVATFETESFNGTAIAFLAQTEHGQLSWHIEPEGVLCYLAYHDHKEQESIYIYYDGTLVPGKKVWIVHPFRREDTSNAYVEPIVRGLFCLGIERENGGDLAYLTYVLTVHEQLQLRHSMPREFWSKKWLDEEDRN